MVLKDNLYRIKSVGSEGEPFVIELNPDCEIYRMHFPGHPITPGVCIIDIVTELLRLYSSKELELKTVSNAKFVTVINPLITPEISIDIKKYDCDESARCVSASVIMHDRDEKIFAKLSLTYSY